MNVITIRAPINRVTVAQPVTALALVNRGIKGDQGPPGTGLTHRIVFVTATSYTTVADDDFLAVRVNSAGAAVTIHFDTVTWPIGVEKSFVDYDLNCAARHIVLDAGAGNVIRGLSDAQNYTLEYNGQRCAVIRMDTHIFMVR